MKIDPGAGAILCPFVYVCMFRLRPNAYPKLEYTRVLLMSVDAPFLCTQLRVWLEGNEKESAVVLARYSIRLQQLPKVPPATMPIFQPIRFRPGEIVNLVLSRDAKPKPLKFHKTEYGGQGVNVFVELNGVKEYQP